MPAVGVGHHVERFAQFDQTIDEALRALVVHVVVARTVAGIKPGCGSFCCSEEKDL